MNARPFEPQFAALTRVPDVALGGSTGAYLVDYLGHRYVYKIGASIKHVINEYIAFKLYELAEVNVPKSGLVYEGETPVGLLLEYLVGESAIGILTSDIYEKEKTMLREEISKSYVFHALFSNYDCNNSENYIVPRLPAGEERVYYNYNNNNWNNNEGGPIQHTQIHAHDNTHVIDLGGALLYRSKGAEKGEAFKTKSVPEIDSITDSTKGTTGKLFIQLADSPALKHRVICQRWNVFDSSVIPRFLTSPPIQSLLVKYEMTGLTKILKGRIEAIDKFCAGKAISSALGEAELDLLSKALHQDIENYKNAKNLEDIKETLKGKTEVLSLDSGDPLQLPLVQAYDKNSVLFRELLNMASKEALNSKGSLGGYVDLRLIHHVIAKGDYDTIVQLILKDVTLTATDLSSLDVPRILREVARISPKGRLFGRVHVAPFVRFPHSDMIWNYAYSGYQPETNLDSVLDKQLLLKKPIRGFTEWMDAQAAYLASRPRITAIVRAYTFRGDKLANSYLRGTLDNPYDILNAIRGDATVPFAYQIFDNYDFLKSQGLTLPPKETLMVEDITKMRNVNFATIRHANIHALYLANFDYFLRLHILHKLIKDFCHDLKRIIKKAPRAPDTMFVYRGIQDENHLKPGTYDYVNTSFVSTSINPYVASSQSFTSPYFGMPIRFCVYEMELKYAAPCIYLRSISHFSEDEILLPYNLGYKHSVDITLKYLCNRLTEFTAETDFVKLERVFVRRLEVSDFTEDAEAKTFAVNLRLSKKKKRVPRINSMHGKTARNPKKAAKVVNNNFELI
jgi:hypothetical protein